MSASPIWSLEMARARRGLLGDYVPGEPQEMTDKRDELDKRIAMLEAQALASVDFPNYDDRKDVHE